MKEATVTFTEAELRILLRCLDGDIDVLVFDGESSDDENALFAKLDSAWQELL